MPPQRKNRSQKQTKGEGRRREEGKEKWGGREFGWWAREVKEN